MTVSNVIRYCSQYLKKLKVNVKPRAGGVLPTSSVLPVSEHLIWATLSLHHVKNNLVIIKYLPLSRGGRENGRVQCEEEKGEGGLFSRSHYEITREGKCDAGHSYSMSDLGQTHVYKETHDTVIKVMTPNIK